MPEEESNDGANCTRARVRALRAPPTLRSAESAGGGSEHRPVPAGAWARVGRAPGSGISARQKRTGKMFLPREILYLSAHNAQVGGCTHTRGRRETERERERERERGGRKGACTLVVAMRTCNLRERKGPFCPLFFPPGFIGLCFTSPPPPENAIRCAANAM